MWGGEGGGLPCRLPTAGTLVHCQAGRSRSASIVISYLMQHHHKSLREAYFWVKERRSLIQPNTGFMTQLQALDKRLFGVHSFDMHEHLTQVCGYGLRTAPQGRVGVGQTCHQRLPAQT